MNGNYGSYGSGNSGNYGYGRGQKKPEPPKEYPEWVTWLVFGAIFVVVCLCSMPSDDRAALFDFLGWSGKIIGLGAILVLAAMWYASYATTEGDAKARGGLVVTILSLLALVLVILAVVRGLDNKLGHELDKLKGNNGNNTGAFLR